MSIWKCSNENMKHKIEIPPVPSAKLLQLQGCSTAEMWRIPRWGWHHSLLRSVCATCTAACQEQDHACQLVYGVHRGVLQLHRNNIQRSDRGYIANKRYTGFAFGLYELAWHDDTRYTLSWVQIYGTWSATGRWGVAWGSDTAEFVWLKALESLTIER